MTDTQTTDVQLPGDPILLRRIARILEQAREWTSLASLLGAMLRLNPQDWRTRLRQHDAWQSAENEAEATRSLEAMLDAALDNPRDTAALRRVLESGGRKQAVIALQARLVARNPKDWRAWLTQYDALRSAGREDEAERCLDSVLTVALDNRRDTATFRRLLENGGHAQARLKMQAAVLARDPADWRTALKHAFALADAGDHARARATITDQMELPSRTFTARKLILEQLLDHGDGDLVAAAFEALARSDGKGLRAYLVGMPESARSQAIWEIARRTSVAEWDPVQAELARVEALENSGNPVEADRLRAAIEPALSFEASPKEATPTPSTLMFRNRALLECLVAAAAWFIERNGTASVHVGACSTGEEAYSLALLLADAGLIDRCELTASDVDPALVRRARKGVLEAKVANAIPGALLERCFRRQADGRLRLDAAILDRIAFSTIDLTQPSRTAARYDILVANNVLVHFPGEGANGMLQAMVGRVQPQGLLCIGGGRQDDLQKTIELSGLVPVTTHADAVFEGWRLQRHAWYVNPRPYWALPPARLTAAEPWRHAALFARSAGTAHAVETRLAEIRPAAG